MRIRGLLYLLSKEIFGEPIAAAQFPRREWLGFGMSDHPCYAPLLQRAFAYTNTFYDREPFFDITAYHPEQYGTYDFIVSSDVFEHVPVPVSRTFEECYRLLKPGGVMAVTVPHSLEAQTREHYPNLYDFAVVPFGQDRLLVNKKKNGEFEAFGNLAFHGGPGSTLEMRVFCRDDLTRSLLAAGFEEIDFLDANVPEIGVVFEDPWTRPFITRKSKSAQATTFPTKPVSRALSGEEIELMLEMNGTLQRRLNLAAQSRWLRLGRMLGLGPKL